MIAYFNGRYLPKEDICIPLNDRGFLFSDSLYEVIRHYPSGLFRPDAHIRRLNHGAEHLSLTVTDFSYLISVTQDLIHQNHLESQDALVYIHVTRGCAPRNHPFPVPAPELTIYVSVSPFDTTARERMRETGIQAITVPDIRWSRCDMKTTGLTANVLANQQAVENGADEAIFVRDGVLMEGTHANFMVVFDDIVMTAPLSNYILGGITRETVLDLCRQQGIRTSESPIYESRIHLASEMMVTGTTMEVTSIVAMDGRPVGNGRPGPTARALQTAFQEHISF